MNQARFKDGDYNFYDRDDFGIDPAYFFECDDCGFAAHEDDFIYSRHFKTCPECGYEEDLT